MYESPFFTKKEALTNYRQKCLPTRPRKCTFSLFTPSGAQAVSFLGSDCSLSQLYDRHSEVSYMEQCFDVISCIGYGCFGVVFKVNSREDGKFYAVKKSKERFRNAGDRKRKLREVERLEKLPKHPNCVQLYQAWEENGYLYLQIELCEVSLAKYALTHHEIPEETLWNVLTDITLALKHLHDRKIMHLDVKLDNILMCSDGSFKLSDFGISLDCSQKPKDAIDGDAKYIAPELLSEIFTRSADIFSLGISMLELSFDLSLPERGELWKCLREGQIPQYRTDSVSTELYELIKWMMHPEHDRRPTVDMILDQNQVKKILLRRKITRLIQCLVASGKFLVSFLSFFGKVGYDVVMAALLKLHPPNQCSNRSISNTAINDIHEDKGDNCIVTSTPVTNKKFENVQETPIRPNESREVCDCVDASGDLERLVYPDYSLNKGFPGCINCSSSSSCKCIKRRRVHPYEKNVPQLGCLCDQKRCSSVRNLINEFSQFSDAED